jgi:hypothetical protein
MSNDKTILFIRILKVAIFQTNETLQEPLKKLPEALKM